MAMNLKYWRGIISYLPSKDASDESVEGGPREVNPTRRTPVVVERSMNKIPADDGKSTRKYGLKSSAKDDKIKKSVREVQRSVVLDCSYEQESTNELSADHKTGKWELHNLRE